MVVEEDEDGYGEDQAGEELELSSAMATAWHGEAYLGGGEGRRGGEWKEEV